MTVPYSLPIVVVLEGHNLGSTVFQIRSFKNNSAIIFFRSQQKCML